MDIASKDAEPLRNFVNQPDRLLPQERILTPRRENRTRDFDTTPAEIFYNEPPPPSFQSSLEGLRPKTLDHNNLC